MVTRSLHPTPTRLTEPNNCSLTKAALDDHFSTLASLTLPKTRSPEEQIRPEHLDVSFARYTVLRETNVRVTDTVAPSPTAKDGLHNLPRTLTHLTISTLARVQFDHVDAFKAFTAAILPRFPNLQNVCTAEE